MITAGAFSTNFSKLVIGDATGKVHLLEVDETVDDLEECSETPPKRILDHASAILGQRLEVLLSKPGTQNQSGAIVRKPKVLIPHPEPPSPGGFGFDVEDDEVIMAQHMAEEFLQEGYLTMHPEPAIGPLQGPNYAETGLFLKVAHENGDPFLPLLPEWEAQQRWVTQSEEEQRLRLPCLPQVASSDRALHERNMNLDLDFARLSLSAQAELMRDGVDLDFEPAQDFDYEISPRSSIFKEHKKHQKRTHNM